MDSFSKENLQNIKGIFENKTGVSLSTHRRRHPAKSAAILVAVLMCSLPMTAFALSLFSSLSGDDLSLSATYEGNGIVHIHVENRSDKELNFQHELKLMQWSTSEEIEPISDNVIFSGTEFEAHTSGIMTVDLSEAYDISILEQPLTDDHYYFVLTNNNFLFGQDWMCSVTFTENITTSIASPEIAPVDKDTIERIEEILQPYFESSPLEDKQRWLEQATYIKTYTQLFAELDGNLVPSVSPILPGNKVSSEIPYLIIGQLEAGVIFDSSIAADEQYLLISQNWSSYSSNYKLLATENEYAMVLSARLPDSKYGGLGYEIPLMYFLTYEKSSIQSYDDLAFIYGQLLTFEEMEQYQVYEDNQYVCYEVSDLLYSDLRQYVEGFIGQLSNVYFDDQVWMRIQNIYNYYKDKEVLGSSLQYPISSEG